MSNDNECLPLESDDDKMLRLFGGPLNQLLDGKTQVQLPSGKMLSPDEIQVFASAFSDECSRFSEDNRTTLLGTFPEPAGTPATAPTSAERSTRSIPWLRLLIWRFYRH